VGIAPHCAKHGVTHTEAVVQALGAYFDREAGGVDAYSLAADLIPKQGVASIQSKNVRELALRAFRGPRSD
jgi:hypothetical protein